MHTCIMGTIVPVSCVPVNTGIYKCSMGSGYIKKNLGFLLSELRVV